MPTLTLTPPNGGKPINVTVSDNFSSLSPADQAAQVEEISGHVFSGQSAPWQPPATDTPVDLSSGGTPWHPPATDTPVDLSAGGTPVTDHDLSTAFRNGAGSLISGLGHAGSILDQELNQH